jgi:uncharacterized damage-inducible protein DinB
MDQSLDRMFLSFSRDKLFQYASRIESCLTKLSEEQIWARGSENQNSVGNLVLHLCGNVRQWIGTAVGCLPDLRERDAEFLARGGISGDDLIRRMRTTLADADSVLSEVTVERLNHRVFVQGYEVTVHDAIYHVVEHFSMHTGQIIFATKLWTGEDLGFYRHLSQISHSEATP